MSCELCACALNKVDAKVIISCAPPATGLLLLSPNALRAAAAKSVKVSARGQFFANISIAAMLKGWFVVRTASSLPANWAAPAGNGELGAVTRLADERSQLSVRPCGLIL